MARWVSLLILVFGILGATVCTTMAILPLMPHLPACETPRVEHAANDTSARL